MRDMAHAEVPTHTEQNHLGLELEMVPFKRGGGIHGIGFSQLSEYRRDYRILPFSQQSWASILLMCLRNSTIMEVLA